MLIDSHIHVGQFNNYYFSPTQIHKLMENVGVDFYAVSSTTQCEENYTKVLDELHALIDLDGRKVLPVMWITPEGLKGNIAWYLESDIKWRCLKIHPFLHQNDWSPLSGQFQEVVDIAHELKIPLLIHTGNDGSCNSGKYESVLANNPNVTFILAHGRPLSQSISLLKRYDNVFVDSAFMSLDDMSKITQAGLSKKLLWGTDMCIPQYFYPDDNLEYMYEQKLTTFHSVCKTTDYECITGKNAIRVFQLDS